MLKAYTTSPKSFITVSTTIFNEHKTSMSVAAYKPNIIDLSCLFMQNFYNKNILKYLI